MPIPRLAIAASVILFAAPVASAEVGVDPLRFFEGRTETRGTVKVMFHKPYWTRSIGAGRIESDGSLTLVQRVEDGARHQILLYSLRLLGVAVIGGALLGLVVYRKNWRRVLIAARP